MRAACVLLALCAIGQQPAFRSGVEMLEVDARVFDREGRFVADLTMDDFELLEDGKRQTIKTFFLVLVGTPAHAADSEAAGRPRGPHTWYQPENTRFDGQVPPAGRARESAKA